MGKESMKNKMNKNNVTWLFLICVTIICVIIAFIYKNSSENEEIAENDSNQEIDMNENETPPELIVDFDDFMDYKQENSYEIYKEDVPIRGIYLTAYSAGNETLDNLIELANETEINSFVIDVKTDSGRLSFDMNIPLAEEIGSEYLAIKDIDELMNKLYDNNIYPIARIVAFKDPFLSSHDEELAIKNQDGSLFYYDGISWLNPYNEKCWEYIVNVAKEAIGAGFKEIQFDYIRFESTYRLENADFGDIDESKTKMDIIVDFLDYVNEELADYDVKISADVFGTIITSQVDAKIIGQNYVEMAKRLDVICPMVYPSHYGRGYYGIPSSELPDSYPYKIIFGSMTDSNKRLEEIQNGKKPIVRPWLQAFNMHGVTYDGVAIREQIQAAYDAGLDEWLLWNAGNRYSTAGILTEEQFIEEQLNE